MKYSAPRVWQRLLCTVSDIAGSIKGELTLWRILDLLGSRGKFSFNLL